MSNAAPGALVSAARSLKENCKALRYHGYVQEWLQRIRMHNRVNRDTGVEMEWI
jgi:hypothetical protein